MMPLLMPKFPPQEKETYAQREIRGFQQKARDTAVAHKFLSLAVETSA